MNVPSRADSPELESESATVYDSRANSTAREERVDLGTERDMTDYLQPASFATKARVIILLALAAWAVLVAGIVTIAG